MTEEVQSSSPAISRGEPLRSGKRRSFSTVEAEPLRWPTTDKERRRLAESWHDISMAVASRERASLRVLAAIWKEIFWETGTITATDERIASRAGWCSAETINRDLKNLVALGLLSKSKRADLSDGKFKTPRTLRLAVPKWLPKGIHLPDILQEAIDHRGQSQKRHEIDHRGQEVIDHRGRSTPVLCNKASASSRPSRSTKVSGTSDQSATEAPSRPRQAGVGAQFDLFRNGESS